MFVVLCLFTACADSNKEPVLGDDIEEEIEEKEEITVPGSTLAEKLQWLTDNAESNNRYLIEVSADRELLTSQTLEYDGRKNIVIRLRGESENRVIGITGLLDALFTITNNITLILDNNITLVGHKLNKWYLVRVDGGTLIVNEGAKISDNGGADKYTYGGGVYVSFNGSFTMNGGEISNNGDCGVSVNGTFTMNGGEISGNMLGGVSVNGTFTMNGGEISGNNSDDVGGGVSVSFNGSFTMNGGEISNNTTTSYPEAYEDFGGGGVYIYGTFTMNGGIISKNTSSGYGGGVYVNGGNFTMSGGTISGNTSLGGYGGGVYVKYEKFRKSGGTITGYADDKMNGNVVKNSSGVVQSNNGHAVYYYFNPVYGINDRRREKTAGPGVNMDPGKGGAAGGWE